MSCVEAGGMCGESGDMHRMFSMAISTFSTECTSGDPMSCFYAANMSLKASDKLRSFYNADSGMKLLRKACDGNHGEACSYLSHIHKSGLHGAEKSSELTFINAEKACMLGHKGSCKTASRMCKKGQGVEADAERVRRLKQQAVAGRREISEFLLMS